MLPGFDPDVILALNLAGTFVFGLSGGFAGVRKHLDAFGVVVLAMAVGMAGGIVRDLLIGRPPETFRDWRYLAAASAAGIVTFLAPRSIERSQRQLDVLDAAGLALFCVAGASTALAFRVPPVQAVVLGAITGIGGGMLRDILINEVPGSCAVACTPCPPCSAQPSSSSDQRPARTASPFRFSPARLFCRAHRRSAPRHQPTARHAPIALVGPARAGIGHPHP